MLCFKNNASKKEKADDVTTSLVPKINPWDDNWLSRGRLNPIAKTIVDGLYDDESPLRHLRYHNDLLKIIWNDIVGSWKLNLKKSTTGGNPIANVTPYMDMSRVVNSYCRIGVAPFPKYKGIKINMMPFRVGDRDSLPKKYQHWWHYISNIPIHASSQGKVAYLTIDESKVEAGKAQRRMGLHTEGPGRVSKYSGMYVPVNAWALRWGGGSVDDQGKFKGGIYMASSVDHTCRIFDAYVDTGIAVEDHYTGAEHLRGLLKDHKSVMLKKNEIYWMTDRTPHEALPMAKAGRRQFFRLVLHEVDVWFEASCTKNFLCQPTAKIIKGEDMDEEVRKKRRKQKAKKKQKGKDKRTILGDDEEVKIVE